METKKNLSCPYNEAMQYHVYLRSKDYYLRFYNRLLDIGVKIHIKNFTKVKNFTDMETMSRMENKKNELKLWINVKKYLDKFKIKEIYGLYVHTGSGKNIYVSFRHFYPNV